MIFFKRCGHLLLPSACLRNWAATWPSFWAVMIVLNWWCRMVTRSCKCTLGSQFVATRLDYHMHTQVRWPFHRSQYKYSIHVRNCLGILQPTVSIVFESGNTVTISVTIMIHIFRIPNIVNTNHTESCTAFTLDRNCQSTRSIVRV